MREKRIACPQCASYDREGLRCRLGKTNPKTKLDSVMVAETLGVQALCLHNPYREPLILRMRFPHQRFLWNEYAFPRLAPPVEVEIVEDESER